MNTPDQGREESSLRAPKPADPIEEIDAQVVTALRALNDSITRFSAALGGLAGGSKRQRRAA
jgi:hypothetical protein